MKLICKTYKKYSHEYLFCYFLLYIFLRKISSISVFLLHKNYQSHDFSIFIKPCFSEYDKFMFKEQQFLEKKYFVKTKRK